MDPQTSAGVLRMRERLEGERTRARRALQTLGAEMERFRQRVGERDPCAYRSPGAVKEAAEQASRSERLARARDAAMEIERAMQRLERDPEGFFACDRCGTRIAAERLELLPQTRVCAECIAPAAG